jgi:large subunit ribosomal protein L1
MVDKKVILESIKKIKQEAKERKFDESIDLIINLKSFDAKRENVNAIVTLPNSIKKPRVIGLLTKRSSVIDFILKEDFDKYSNKKEMKKIIDNHDFFIAAASLMPTVATKFGRYLGQAGKMPSPQLGVLMNETDEEIQKLVLLMERTIKVKSKEPSLKFIVAKKSMEDEKISENILKAISIINNALPKREQNIKNIMIKLTMGKPIRLQ